MDLVGRDAGGRYLYRVVGTGWGRHEVALTHEQRVKFAALRALVAQVKPGTELLPANLRTCLGRGSVGGSLIWLPVDAELTERTCKTIAHELVHNDGLSHGRWVRHYSKAWTDRQAFWSTKLFMATKGWKAWPKVRGLRHTLAPQQRKARAAATRDAKAKATTPAQAWQKKRDHAAAMLEQWARREKAAARKAKKWRASLKRAERRLADLEEPSRLAALPGSGTVQGVGFSSSSAPAQDAGEPKGGA